jgi:DNA-binding transcriptional MerR regulator
MTELLKVSQVARELGVSVDWLRRAEKQGRIPPAKRQLSGWRVYTSEDVVVLRDLLLSGISQVGLRVALVRLIPEGLEELGA